MTTVQQALKTALSGDVTLAALATGGIHDLASLGRQQLEITDLTSGTPIIRPAVLIRWTTQTPFSAAVLKARRGFVELYYYDDSANGYATIRSMRERVFALLHRQTVTITEPTNDYVWRFSWAGVVEEQTDESLGGAAMERDRYEYFVTKE